MNPDEDKIHLNYSFATPENIFQGIYYAHIHGTTFAIGANMTRECDKSGKVIGLKGTFISKVMGGKINFCLDSIDSVILKEDESKHRMVVRLKIFHNKDADLRDIDFTFEEPFDPIHDILKISIKDDEGHIVNLEDGMLNVKKKKADNDRSCWVCLI